MLVLSPIIPTKLVLVNTESSQLFGPQITAASEPNCSGENSWFSLFTLLKFCFVYEIPNWTDTSDSESAPSRFCQSPLNWNWLVSFVLLALSSIAVVDVISLASKSLTVLAKYWKPISYTGTYPGISSVAVHVTLSSSAHWLYGLPLSKGKPSP